MTISGKPSKTDWERVRKSIATDALIPYDPEDGPYDPNDDEAVESFLTEANRINPARHTDEPPISKAS
jgi:ribosomal protein S18